MPSVMGVDVIDASDWTGICLQEHNKKYKDRKKAEKAAKQSKQAKESKDTGNDQLPPDGEKRNSSIPWVSDSLRSITGRDF